MRSLLAILFVHAVIPIAECATYAEVWRARLRQMRTNADSSFKVLNENDHHQSTTTLPFVNAGETLVVNATILLPPIESSGGERGSSGGGGGGGGGGDRGTLFLPTPVRGGELLVFPDPPCSGDAAPETVEGCNVDRARSVDSQPRFAIVAPPGVTLRDGPLDATGAGFPVYEEEWAVECLGLSDTVWECNAASSSRRDFRGSDVGAGGVGEDEKVSETAASLAWSLSTSPFDDPHGQVYMERLLERGRIDWAKEIPLCDVPVFDARAEQARADEAGVPLHEVFSDRFRRDGAHGTTLIVNDPHSFADDRARIEAALRSPPGSEARPLGFRNSAFGPMATSRYVNAHRITGYIKSTHAALQPAILAIMGFPAYEDPVCLRDPRVTPHADITDGSPTSEVFFLRHKHYISGSGRTTQFHTHRANWLHLATGIKVWFLHPPRTEEGESSVLKKDVSDELQLRLNAWLHGPVNGTSLAATLRSGKAPRVCIQKPGTTMFVGDDWYHAVANIGVTSAFGAFSQATAVAIVPPPETYTREYPEDGHTSRSRRFSPNA